MRSHPWSKTAWDGRADGLLPKKSKKRDAASIASAQHYGYPPIEDITVGSRFFFFQTLQSGSEKESPEAGAYRLQVYNAAMNILNNEGLQKQKDNEGAEQIQAALNFLKSATEY